MNLFPSTWNPQRGSAKVKIILHLAVVNLDHPFPRHSSGIHRMTPPLFWLIEPSTLQDRQTTTCCVDFSTATMWGLGTTRTSVSCASSFTVSPNSKRCRTNPSSLAGGSVFKPCCECFHPFVVCVLPKVLSCGTLKIAHACGSRSCCREQSTAHECNRKNAPHVTKTPRNPDVQQQHMPPAATPRGMWKPLLWWCTVRSYVVLCPLFFWFP